ncbi:type VII secretion AAA-ATPase EccA [Mycobacteroides abscessus]|uniref:type VII secretion AAA-ATPase EccA n=1 Tax=Mycobacteroides abscessus TaxID=36809 RepID=UPI0009A72657|nr:type VII secretion AAA-ATPase EccA [Mycobacteroides abscessus]SKH87059.1 type VII secretion AAA-ATPase EccA [Mycobacteroides abscessus subsp. massiliense]SKH91559.1 type VII secretion AAA-ATPase EccA [Mycobacteroides abscessus subsp. massiliense]SKI12363.1 type VII secretion AAA-ATPase EccA [Mycobacteroides abscessus subsp. massiliense]SKK23213.1 type VII secretion AAA-ATPase EccA [Mycobacteroides abscessus subsp. massiliense]SKK30016.1 type VII secretion AAA-ATPase EccA [Mycobacteroides ab
MTAAGALSLRAFEAGLLALGFQVRNSREPVNVGLARQVLAKATETDPTMADAWLARLAAGETTLGVYEGLWNSRAKLGAALDRYGLTPLNMRRADGSHVNYESGLLIVAPIASEDAVTAAYVAALVRDGQRGDDVHRGRRYDKAVEVLNGQTGASKPFTTYGAAVLYHVTERWREVVEAASLIRDCTDPVVAAGARVVLISAYTNQGLYRDALNLEDEALSDGRKIVDVLPQAKAGVKFYTAMCHRRLGDEEHAAENLRAALVADPEYQTARDYLNDPKLTLRVIDQTVIDSRTDPWNPDSGKSDEELAEPEISDEDRAAMLAEADELLESFIGLEAVKEQVSQLKNLVAINQMRIGKGLKEITKSNHLVFAGPPGTGKTTIARVVAKIYCGLGLLKTDKVLEVFREDLCGQHIGETEAKTLNKILEALDGVLFIDEAYALAATGMKNDFGLVAINTLLAQMENYRHRLVVIVAGYKGDMKLFMGANDGLPRRFPVTISFPPYTPDELVQIAVRMADREQDQVIGAQATDLLLRVCERVCVEEAIPAPKPTDPHPLARPIADILGNAGFMRNVTEQAAGKLADRLNKEGITGDADATVFTTYTEADMRGALDVVLGDDFRNILDAA